MRKENPQERGTAQDTSSEPLKALIQASEFQEGGADGCRRGQEVSRLFIGCAQKDNTLTLAHANTTGRAHPRSLPALQWGVEADDSHEMPNTTALYPILHSVPMSDSGQGLGGLSSDLGSKSSKSTEPCLQALLRDQGSQSAQQAMQGCCRGGADTRGGW